jgi:hypothetical protein
VKYTGSVRFHDDVVRAAKALALESIGEDRPRAVFLQPDDRAIGHRTNDETALWIEREAIRSDQKRRRSSAPRLLSDVEEVGAGVAGVLEEHRDRLARLPLVDHVVQHVAEQQVPGRALLDPDRALGQAKAIPDQFRLCSRVDDLIECRIELHDRECPFCRCLPTAQELCVCRNAERGHQEHGQKCLRHGLRSPPVR